MAPSVPAQLSRTVRELYGEAGRAWLEHLPALLDACADRWGLRLLEPFPELSYAYVVPVVRADGAAAVLKVGVPNPETVTEIAALRAFGGRGMVELLDADPGWGALLLERLQPGTMLAAVEDDEEATRIAAAVMRRLWRPAPAGGPFPTLERWFAALTGLRRRFDGGTGPLPGHLVDRAERLLPDLLSTQGAAVLLHGDLHHMNILRAERERWLALDPKGVLGEPAYEVGAFLYNPPAFPARPDMRRRLFRRLEILSAELNLPQERLAAWGIAQAVLSACWSLEDGGDWKGVLACAEVLVDR